VLYYPPGEVDGKPRLPIALGLLAEPHKVLAEYGKLIGPLPRPRTLGDGIDKYLLEIVPELAERTQEDYRAYCAKLKKGLGHMLPDEVEITDLYDYHGARKAPVRANREITVLGVIYRHLIRWRAATRNPVQGFLYADEKDRERRVTGSERRRFAAGFVPDWMRGYLTLKYLTGRRQGEMLKLGLFSERERGLAFRILKKRRYRELLVEWTPRVRRVWAWLKARPRPKNSAMIFPASKGKRRGQALSARGFKSAWQRAQADWITAGNEAFWEHDIRAATATAAKSDEAARELLDHETVRTTKSYRRGESRAKPLS
jgi:hypothetical protein